MAADPLSHPPQLSFLAPSDLSLFLNTTALSGPVEPARPRHRGRHPCQMPQALPPAAFRRHGRPKKERTPSRPSTSLRRGQSAGFDPVVSDGHGGGGGLTTCNIMLLLYLFVMRVHN